MKLKFNGVSITGLLASFVLMILAFPFENDFMLATGIGGFIGFILGSITFD